MQSLQKVERDPLKSRSLKRFVSTLAVSLFLAFGLSFAFMTAKPMTVNAEPSYPWVCSEQLAGEISFFTTQSVSTDISILRVIRDAVTNDVISSTTFAGDPVPVDTIKGALPADFTDFLGQEGDCSGVQYVNEVCEWFDNPVAYMRNEHTDYETPDPTVDDPIPYDTGDPNTVGEDTVTTTIVLEFKSWEEVSATTRDWYCQPYPQPTEQGPEPTPTPESEDPLLNDPNLMIRNSEFPSGQIVFNVPNPDLMGSTAIVAKVTNSTLHDTILSSGCTPNLLVGQEANWEAIRTVPNGFGDYGQYVDTAMSTQTDPELQFVVSDTMPSEPGGETITAIYLSIVVGGTQQLYHCYNDGTVTFVAAG
jgi:hypothetical protein